MDRVHPSDIARLSYDDEERCGLVLDGDIGDDLIFIKLINSAKDPSHSFAIDPNDVNEVLSARHRIVGVWHTHPPLSGHAAVGEDGRTGPRPSATDLDYHPVGLGLWLAFEGNLFLYDEEGRCIQSWLFSEGEGWS